MLEKYVICETTVEFLFQRVVIYKESQQSVGGKDMCSREQPGESNPKEAVVNKEWWRLASLPSAKCQI